MRHINGQLKDYDFQSLLDKVKARGESLFTTLEHDGFLYDFTIRAVEFITVINENTKWQFTVYKSSLEENGDEELISKYGECTNLLEKDLIQKMDEYRERIINGEFNR